MTRLHDLPSGGWWSLEAALSCQILSHPWLVCYIICTLARLIIIEERLSYPTPATTVACPETTNLCNNNDDDDALTLRVSWLWLPEPCPSERLRTYVCVRSSAINQHLTTYSW